MFIVSLLPVYLLQRNNNAFSNIKFTYIVSFISYDIG